MSKELFSLNKLMEGKNLYTALLEQTRGLVEKWETTGLLEGLGNENEKKGMAILLENQARQLLDEVSQTGGANAEQWTGVALPLVRRIFGEIASKEFVSLQPMNLPSGLVFYLDFKYGAGAQPGFTQGGSVYGGSNFGKTEAATGGLYGAGKFGYSSNDYSYSASVADATAISGSGYGNVSWKDINFNADLSQSIVDTDLTRVSVTASVLTNPDLNGVRAFSISSSDATAIYAYYPEYTSYSSGWINFIVSGSGTTSGSNKNIEVKYHKQPTAAARGDFEDITESGSAHTLDIPEIDVQLQSEPIVAKTKKLKAVWTPELAQDLNAYHSIDAEAELTAMLSEYIAMEIDLEILDMLIQNALTTEFWSVRPGYEYNSTTELFYDASSHYGTKNEWFQTLGNKIQRVSNKIHQLTMRGGANFIVVSPDVATVVESIPGYAADTDGNQMSFAMGVQKVGMLNSRFTVYKNPYMLENVILVGFRGNAFLETGAIYAPYVPLIMTPLIWEPNNFTPRRGVMTRYAKKIVRPEFYGKVIVEGAHLV